ncbi:tyrosine--tRNA ligase [Candidatus Parcubacteria bacterium]|nr:tyrosine--tRNA ligase [Candidatus Parcubacteria bacterium]
MSIDQILTRGVAEIIDKESLVKRLNSGKELRIKLGIDPTSPNIHLGRSIPLLKLKDFQDLGHIIILLVGDFTGLIGDTSDKDSERPMLAKEAIAENLKTYIEQAGKILDMSKVDVVYNSTWLSKLNYFDICEQADLFSINQFISRENISKRLDEGKRVSLRELMYPLMQGYDSVELKADVELGGTDQKFNLLAGRDLQRHYKQEPQDILMGPIIEGLDGRKMSSSYGNGVNLMDSANDMFGKIMSLNDEFIIKYFTLLTRVDLEAIAGYEKDLKNGTNPRDVKILLGKELVKMYHSADDADKAEQYFINTFTKKEIPDDIEELAPADYNIVNILIESKLAESKSEARRVIEQGGVKVNGEVLKDVDINIDKDSVIQKGKMGFVKIK